MSENPTLARDDRDPASFAEVVDTMLQFHPPGIQSVPVPREALRDEQSLGSWPNTGIVDHLFGDASRRSAAARDPREIVVELDRWNIASGILTVDVDHLGEVTEALGEHVQRFWFAVRVDAHKGMRAVRSLRAAADNPRVRACALTPFAMYPPTPADSRECYPIYAECINLDLPLCITVGFPGPRVPAASQHPMALDQVCWFFPELNVVMRHGGQPWAGICADLLRKWPNLYYSTSAYAPHRYPAEIVRLLRGRHNAKILYGGYWPTLAFDRIFAEIRDLDLTDDQVAGFLHGNARKVFRL